MNRYLLFLCIVLVQGCSDNKQTESLMDDGKISKYSNTLLTYDSLLFKYGGELQSSSMELNVQMVIEHASVGNYFVYTLFGNDSTMRMKFSIVNEREVVLSLERLLWLEEAVQTTDSLRTLLSTGSFWKLSNDTVDCEGADGTTYMLKIKQGENENQILRWSPVLCELPKGEDILRSVDYLLSLVKTETYETRYFD